MNQFISDINNTARKKVIKKYFFTLSRTPDMERKTKKKNMGEHPDCVM